MESKPLVTVLMPSYNEPEKFISETIESVLKQTYSDFEYIIVDDSKSEETIKCIDRYAERDHRIKVIRKDHPKGVSAARNLGIKEAKGFYILNIDADDVCFPDRIENQLSCFQSTDVVAVGGNVKVINEYNEITSIPKPLNPRWDIIQKHLNYGIVDMYQPTSMIKKSVLLEVGGYDENLQCAEDFDLWYKVAVKYKWTIAPVFVIKYRIHGANAHLLKQEMQANLCCIGLIKYSLGVDRCLTKNEFDKLSELIRNNIICQLYIKVRSIKNRYLVKIFGSIRLSNYLANRIIRKFWRKDILQKQ